MNKYRKKPVVVEAIQWKPQEMLIGDVRNFMGVSGGMERMGILSMGKFKGELIIKTLEGEMTVSPNDWIIKGVQGEFYPCKPDIFEHTYEPVEVNHEGN